MRGVHFFGGTKKPCQCTSAEYSFFDNANLGRSKDPVADLPASLHHDLDRVILVLALCHCEDGVVQSWVKLFSLRIVLHHLEALENFVHDISRHRLPFHVCFELVFDVLEVLACLNSLHIGVLKCHSHGVAHLKQVFRKLSDCKLLFILDHLAVPLHSLLVLLDLLGELDAS